MFQLPPSFTLVDLVPLAVIALMAALPVMCVFLLVRTRMPDFAKVLWILIILGVPLIGPALFVLSRLIMAGAAQAGLVNPPENKEPHAT